MKPVFTGKNQVIASASCLWETRIDPGFPSQAMQSRTPIDVASLGPQVGEQVPDFTLPDQTGRVWTRDSILGPNGAVVLFHRSANW